MAGGSIDVFPDALAAAAGDLQHSAQSGLELRGNFSRAASAAGACDPVCAGAFQEMQDALARGLASLQEEVSRFGPQTEQAATGYTGTDRSIAKGFTGGAS